MLISIITINYNNLYGLKKTIESVLEQTYKQIEYVIIDGGSNDGSKEYIQSKNESITYWVSEPDKGIYDGMNKGIKHINGSYVLFLNSGDTLFNDTIISEFVQQNPIEDIVYGDAMLLYGDKKPVRKCMPVNLKGTTVFTKTVTHQAIFFKSSIFENINYDLRYKYIADWVLYNTIVLLNNGTYRHINLVIVNFDMTGLSSAKENVTHLKKERELFYKENASFFDPLLEKHKELTLKQIKNAKRPIVIRWLIKVFRKFNYYKKVQ